MKDLRGKTVLVTGAASGIGRLMSLYFADEGANLAIVDINEKQLADVCGEVESRGVKCLPVVCDITGQDRVKKTVGKVTKELGNVDVLVNNAGIVSGKKFIDLSVEEMRRTMEVNYWGHVYFTRLVLPGMMERNEGNIVNIASSAGLLGMPVLSDYSASKFADVGTSEALRRELKNDGYKNIYITCVCPYIIDTGMFEGFKPFLLNPFVKSEKAARAIVKAVKKNKPYVYLPYGSIKMMTVLKLMPARIFDYILNVAGAGRAMESFKGRAR